MLAHNHDRLILFAPVALGLGIGLWFALPVWHWRLAMLLAALAVALAGLAFSGMARRVLLLFGLLVALGLVAADYRAGSVAPPLLHHRLTAYPVIGTIISRQARDGGAVTRLVIARPEQGADPPHRVRVAFDHPLPPEFRAGAVIRVPATLGPVPGSVWPGGHDGLRRAWFAQISATGRATGPPAVLTPARRPPVLLWLDGVRLDLSDLLLGHLGADRGGIAIALLVGDQGHIAPAQADAMRIAGLSHLMSVSGFHVGVVVAATLLMVRRLVALWPWAALRISARAVGAGAAALAGVGYALLSGADVPAIRAAIMALVILWALAAGRNPLTLRLLGLAALVILIPRPEVLLTASFQLSFAAVAGLLLLAESPLGARIRPQPEDRVHQRAARWFLALLLSGLVAELLLTPIALAHFGRSGSFGVLANLLAIPLTGMVIMPLVALLLLAAPIGLAGLVAVPLSVAIGLLAWVAQTVAGWPGSTLAMPILPPMVFALLACGTILAALLKGPARLAGLPLAAAGVLLLVLARPPDLVIPADGRQVALVGAQALHPLAPHQRGYRWRQWEDALRRPEGVPIRDLPAARCSAAACRLQHRGQIVLMGLGPNPAPAACRAADVVILPGAAPAGCQPRQLLLDGPARREAGPGLVWLAPLAVRHQAGVAGDHPWSPSALPGRRVNLLGQPVWTGVIAE